MAYGDGVVPNQDVFNNEPYNPLSFRDAQGISGAAQASEERSEGFRQA